MKILFFTLLITSALFAESVSFWKVQKVKSNDSLNIRTEATHKSDKISSIPFNAQCVKNHGCGKDLDFESMMKMQEEEVKAFLAQAKEGWCYVEYKGKLGWVSQYYLSPSKTECK